MVAPGIRASQGVGTFGPASVIKPGDMDRTANLNATTGVNETISMRGGPR